MSKLKRSLNIYSKSLNIYIEATLNIPVNTISTDKKSTTLSTKSLPTKGKSNSILKTIATAKRYTSPNHDRLVQVDNLRMNYLHSLNPDYRTSTL